MSNSLGLTIVVYALLVAAACGWTAATGRRRPRATSAALVLLEIALAGQAILDVVALARGQHGPEVATNLGYLLTSLAVLPVCVGAVRADPGRWGSAAFAVAAVLTIVVSLRLHATLGTPRG